MVPHSPAGRLKELKDLAQKLRRFTDISSLLAWDQETYLPPAAVQDRSEQLGLLETLSYEIRTSAQLGALVHELEHTTLPTQEDRALVREMGKIYHRSTRIPQDLALERVQLASTAQHAWAQARKASDFSLFIKPLTQTVELTRKIADKLGWQDHPYDALLEDYESGATTAQITALFDQLQGPLSDLAKKISQAPQVDSRMLHRDFPRADQETLARWAAGQIGFDWDRGRLDVTTHPFCTTLGAQDVRLTTRYDENFFSMAFYGVLHEAGHGLYEQGFDPGLWGTPLSNAASLGIHESQSRFWENLVGRSWPFVQWAFPQIQKTFPSLQDVKPRDFYKALNKVESSFIRVEADEVTYGLHIILRFNLEKALVAGTLKVQDLPEAWNAEFQKLLGLQVPSDALGCLQDVHWSMGGLGYFPTYTLGNLYSAQFLHKMRQDLPNWDNLVTQGTFAPILGWLGQEIHRHGALETPSELVQRVTGEPLQSRYFMDYLQKKYGEIYEL